jgi:hypothetical protein
MSPRCDTPLTTNAAGLKKARPSTNRLFSQPWSDLFRSHLSGQTPTSPPDTSRAAVLLSRGSLLASTRYAFWRIFDLQSALIPICCSTVHKNGTKHIQCTSRKAITFRLMSSNISRTDCCRNDIIFLDVGRRNGRRHDQILDTAKTITSIFTYAISLNSYLNIYFWLRLSSSIY